MELYLIRHAQSTNNALADMRRRVCDPPLSELGRRQAERLAEYLAARRDELGITHLYCSPMWRCLQTARPVAQALGLRPVVWRDVHEFGGVYLDEATGGTEGFPGKTRAEMLQEFGDYEVPAEITECGWWNGPREEQAVAVARACGVAKRLRERVAGDERIALVSHGDFLDALLMELLGQSDGPGAYYLLDNASMSHLHVGSDGFVVVRYINRSEQQASGST